MGRPKSIRLVEEIPAVRCFKPVGTIQSLDEVFITLDEIEAIRLSDLEGQYQEKVAQKMNVSRQTVGRIITLAHKKIADALINGKVIKLEGGPIQFSDGGYFRRCGEDWQFEKSTVDHNVEITKLAISSEKPTLDGRVDLRFGRSKHIIIINLKDDSIEVLDNSTLEKSFRGRGELVAKKVIETGAQVVITGNIGQKAIRILTAAGIRVFLVSSGSVKDASEEFRRKTTLKNKI